MSFEDLLDLANLYHTHGESLMKIFSFFTYLPRFKNDTLVVQDSNVPPSSSSCYLPKSVTDSELLANLCETAHDGVDRLSLTVVTSEGGGLGL